MKATNSVGYYALCSTDAMSGVAKKIDGFVAAARRLGYSASRSLEPPQRGAHLRLLRRIALAKEEQLVVRGTSYAMFLLLPAMAVARLRGCRVTLEIATPMRVAFREVCEGRDRRSVKVLKLLGLALSGPWCFVPANRIVQFAEESSWFQLGCRHKTVLLGNGIDVSAVPVRKSLPPWPSQVIRLIAVGELASWHGFDRMMRAVHAFNRQSDYNGQKARLTIVGDGPDRKRLSALSAELKLDSVVNFTGRLTGASLRQAYEDAHIAVSSLGLHRIGLQGASVLKAREYCAVGLPFIAAGPDPDFGERTPFRFCVPMNEEIEELLSELNRIATLPHLPSPETIRSYALERLDFGAKLKCYF